MNLHSSFRRILVSLGWALMALAFSSASYAEDPTLPSLAGISREPFPSGACPQPCEINAVLAGGDLAIVYYDYHDAQKRKIAVYSPGSTADSLWTIQQTIEVTGPLSELMASHHGAFFLGTSVYQKRRGLWVESQVLQPAGTPLAVAAWGQLVTYLTQTETGSEVFVYRKGRLGRYNLEARLAVAAQKPASLAVGFGMIAVGAPQESDGAGVVHVFARGARGWRLQQILSPSQSETRAFGQAVAVSAQWLAVGAPESPGSAGESSYGEVILYRRKGQARLVESQRLIDSIPLPPDSMWSRFYGDHLALHGRWLLISAKPGYLINDPQVFLARAQGGVWSTVASRAFSFIYGIRDLHITQNHAIAVTIARRGDSDVGVFPLTPFRHGPLGVDPYSPNEQDTSDAEEW